MGLTWGDDSVGFLNDSTTYGWGTKLLHWFVAVLLSAQFVLVLAAHVVIALRRRTIGRIV